MYTITLLQDGTYRCIGHLQDSREEWTAKTLDEAIKSMKNFAKVMNGTKIKKKSGIEYLKEVPVQKPEFVPFNPWG